MKKRLLALLLILVAVFALAACGTPAVKETPAAGSSAAAPSEIKVFKHGFDKDYPPYSYIDKDGKTSGFDVEIAQALCELKGWKHEQVPFAWDAKDAELKSGACDCIWSGFTVEGRENDYTWSFPYSTNVQVILVAENSPVKTLADLEGKLVGVQTATSAYTMLTEGEVAESLGKTFKELKVYESYPVAITDLKAGAIDAVAIDITQAKFHMSNTEGLVILDEKLSEENYAIGFRLGDDALKKEVEEGLKELVASGKYDEIAKKYPDIYEYLTLLPKK